MFKIWITEGKTKLYTLLQVICLVTSSFPQVKS